MDSKESRREAIDTECSPPEPETPASSHAEASSTPTKRSDVLRHVFPRSHVARNSSLTSGISSRMEKLSHRSSPALSLARHSKPRVAFHKALTSIFNTSPTAITAPIPHNPNSSASSSIRSRANSNSLHGSVPSLEFVSSGAFIFSGPSLRSQSGSFNNSTPRLPSLREDSEDFNMLRRANSDTFSSDDMVVERGILRTMSDVLYGFDTPSPIEELTSSSFEVLAEVHSLGDESFLAPIANQSLVISVLAVRVIPYLDRASLKALRSTCKAWRTAIDGNSPPPHTASHGLPNEILQNIYKYLGPRSFNAARHVCRRWMRASLDRKLLRTMLERGGWLDCTENLQSSPTITSEPWSLSRMLSRECSLSFEWTGSGVPTKNRQNSGVFAEVSHTDFTDLAGGHSGSEARGSGGLNFTTSICGQYLLVGRETIIYVYHIEGSSLVPATSIICPRRVLAMSMDVSSGRYAVAALLEGRMGMVCELRFRQGLSDDPPVEILVRRNNHAAGRQSRVAAYSDSQTTYIESIYVKSNHQATSLHAMHDQRTYAQNYINHTSNLNLQGPRHNISPTGVSDYEQASCTLPVEDGTSTFYRHLCSEDDPPRSISICPQRRCVAFGCAAGIELHWIDALSEQSLSRWFPLTAPSDYLHFLAPRPGFESAKKLRLISSAAHPNDKPGITGKFFFGHPNVSSFWGSFGFENHPRRLGSPNIDHYHAVPLSDGHHVLFIDSKTEKLFLGCDAPLGGPIKLLRKVMFLPLLAGNQAPRLYTAAFDMSFGARVVVVFGDTLVLYSIPPDVCKLSRTEQKADSWDVYTALPFANEGRTEDHWLNCEWLQLDWNRIRHKLTASIYRPDFRLISPVTSRVASPDFTTYGPERPVGFDGHCSQILRAPNRGSSTYSEQRLVKRLPRAMSLENDEWVDFLDVCGCDAWFEENGDVMMVGSSQPDDIVEMGGLLTSWIGAVGCARWRYRAGRGG
ncbi:hypothetical protein P171DRAFT_457021 [Karstenula rhodostoma CBS 690.94]|uniref:F-box domain-containing protein n=1 Tax=Karstenula rhodostoma CBS 690.94 TaxID=1392251 RepID=A0A9P4U8E5_9PLEO|nr:hypothetical protein P171DRAFT_457021 [Karstenula rhodostoma CBS 690.94]